MTATRAMRMHLWLFVVALAIGGCGHDSTPLKPAELVLQNGGIYTVDAQRSWAEAVAVRAGEIIAVGTNADVEDLIGPATRIVDLTGQIALPGFHDAHVHALEGGHGLVGCSLVGATEMYVFTAEETLAFIRDCAAKNDAEWLVVFNFDLALFPAEGPHKSLLDAIESDRPVYVSGWDGHSAWVNSKALELAGITADTPDPPLGVIEREPATGEPTGTLRETAMKLVERIIPAPTAQQNAAALEAALAAMHEVGITSYINIEYTDADWQAHRALDQAGRLKARVLSSLTYGTMSSYPPETFDALLRERLGYASERIAVDSIKLFLDGVLEGETAALLEPYAGMGDHRGTLNFQPDELAELAARFDADGLKLHLHAIGDRAVRAGLDAIEVARERNGNTGNRHQIVHLQLVHPDDIPRFAKLGVAATFQAQWAYPDSWIKELNLPVVGQARVERMYPIGSIHRAGGRVVGGSDWDVSSIDPLDAIETAVRRQDPWEQEPGVLNASERVDLATMIDAYTIEAAWLMNHEDQVGSIEVGKRADIIVLDRNLFDIPPAEINQARVLMTVFDGDILYEAPASEAGEDRNER
jgi:predicted amidohydrolase YtcJ